jgi:hypothetical protein
MLKRLLCKALISIYIFIVSAFARLPWRFGKVLGLRYLSEKAIRAGNLEKAESRAKELLSLAEAYKSDFPRGNIIHDGNTLLGSIAMKKNKIEDARNYLRLAGSTPGSPQLNSFGPNMTLANDLLYVGERETVVEYFELCRKFWQMDFGKLDYWTAQVRAGQIPDFGANLRY